MRKYTIYSGFHSIDVFQMIPDSVTLDFIAPRTLHLQSFVLKNKF
jgi:hypothetical protein